MCIYVDTYSIVNAHLRSISAQLPATVYSATDCVDQAK